MLLVAIGAGASMDLVAGRPDDPLEWRPPLTNELVANSNRVVQILNTVPQHAASGLVGTVRGALGSSSHPSLETILDGIASDGGDDTPEFLGFRMFLQAFMAMVSTRGVEDIGEATNQPVLVRTIERWRRKRDERVVYVTFNYDTILDRALAFEYGWTGRSMDAYIADERFALIKLHGSYDWAQATTLPSKSWKTLPPGMAEIVVAIREELMNAARDGIQLVENEYRVVSRMANQPSDWLYETAGRDAKFLVPALALPLGTKARFSCPSSHEALLDSLLPQVDRIITIGWKAGEPLFLRKLSAVRPHSSLSVVNRTPGSRQVVFERLRDAGASVLTPAPDTTQYEWAFGSFLREGALDAFLSA